MTGVDDSRAISPQGIAHRPKQTHICSTSLNNFMVSPRSIRRYPTTVTVILHHPPSVLMVGLCVQRKGASRIPTPATLPGNCRWMGRTFNTMPGTLGYPKHKRPAAVMRRAML